MTRWPSQKPGCHPLTFFLLKRRRLYFKKIVSGDPVKTRNPDLRQGRVWKLWINLLAFPSYMQLRLKPEIQSLKLVWNLWINLLAFPYCIQLWNGGCIYETNIQSDWQIEFWQQDMCGIFKFCFLKKKGTHTCKSPSLKEADFSFFKESTA